MSCQVSHPENMLLSAPSPLLWHSAPGVGAQWLRKGRHSVGGDLYHQPVKAPPVRISWEVVLFSWVQSRSKCRGLWSLLFFTSPQPFVSGVLGCLSLSCCMALSKVFLPLEICLPHALLWHGPRLLPVLNRSCHLAHSVSPYHVFKSPIFLI